MSMLEKLKASKLSRSTPIVEDAVKSRCSDVLPGIDSQFLQRKMRVVRLIPMRASPSVRQLALGLAVNPLFNFIATRSRHGNWYLRLFGNLPAQIRRILAEGPGESWCVGTEIFLKDNVIGGDKERHCALL